jgi:antitoxin component HigA of HigAB toxin-antitoxin module
MPNAPDITKLQILRNDSEYDIVTKEIDQLLDKYPLPGSEDYERLVFLSDLVEAYDDIHFPIDK